MVEVEAGTALCVIDGYRYSESEMGFDPGDILVLISDGITEAQNTAQELYGRQRVLDRLGAMDEEERRAAAICRRLYEDVKRFSEGAGQSDDITVMAVGYRMNQMTDDKEQSTRKEIKEI